MSARGPRGWVLAGAALVAYALLAPTTIVAPDNAEMCSLAALGGRAHPSGYPLYVLWLRATSWLPAASPAHAASLATAILAAAAVAALHAACRAWGARPAAAGVAVAIVAACPLVLVVHDEAEVFALNSLVVSLVLWLAADGGPTRGVRRCAALGLVAGLGLANHMTCALVAPVGVLGVVRGIREAGAGVARVRAGAAAVGALALGLLPYLYVFAAPDTPASWGHGGTLDDLAAHVLRRDYGGPGSLSVGGERAPAAHLAALAGGLARAWLVVPLLLGLAAIAVRAVRGPDRPAWIAFAVTWTLAGPALASRFDFPLDNFGTHIVQRFWVLPAWLLAVPVASAFEALLARARRLGTISDLRVELVAVGVFAVLVVAGLPASRAQHSPAYEQGVSDTLGALPPDAVLIVDSDDLVFGTTYLQEVRGLRPDVTVVARAMLGIPWYRDRLAVRGVHVPLERKDGDPPSVRLAIEQLAAGRPVFVEGYYELAAQALPSYPFAGVVRVLPRGTQVALDDVIAQNQAAFARFDLSDPRPGPDDGTPAIVRVRFADTWSRLARALRDAGRPDDAAVADAAALQLAPQ